LAAQESPGCRQNDEGWHAPAVQRPEQQAPFDVHEFPKVRQALLSAAHFPPLHVWLQHWPFVVHAVLSEAHVG